jgi:hypothetical protein
MVLVSSVLAGVEYGSLKGITQSVTLEEGETFTVMANNFNSGSQTDISIYIPASSTSASANLAFYTKETGSGVGVKSSPIPDAGTIAGPCRIRLYDAGKYCSYKITRPDVVVEASPMNIIALPADNNGDVDLLVEVSADLLSWTPIYSGSAGTSNSAAFFRTRLIAP